MFSADAAHPPLRVAIIGAGPAGFYAAEYFLKQKDLKVEVDLFDQLPTPYGLVRFGVAPDHQKIKNVIRIFAKTAKRPGFRFFGNIKFGRDVVLSDLKKHYHQVCFTTGTQVDRRLGIPGEDLEGSYSATDFVAWYNGHPDYRNLTFDLSSKRVVVVGVGNVAIDVARILCKTPDELSVTDVPDYALEALSASGVKEVYMLGRRGPAQAAFTNPEIKEMGELADAEPVLLPEEVALDAVSQSALGETPGRAISSKLAILNELSARPSAGKSKQFHLRFLVSPVELIDNGNGHVGAVKMVRNALYQSEDGRLRPKPTNQSETLSAGAVFRSVGYRGVALSDVPFFEKWGTIPNDKGRITDTHNGKVVTGLYAAGWIKRGPSGVVGTNKADAVETVKCMIEDWKTGKHWNPECPISGEAESFLVERQPDLITFADWEKLDAMELEAGQKAGKPRVKFTDVEEMLRAIGKR